MNNQINVEPITEQTEAPKKQALPRLGPWSKLGILLLVSIGVRLALSPILLNDADRKDFVATAHKTLRYGVARYYEPSREYHGVKNDAGERGVPLTYPPIQIYCYWVVGHIYDLVFDPHFKEIPSGRGLPIDALALNYLVKLPLFLFELLIAAVIFVFLRGPMGDGRALMSSALYALNPAVLFDGALWAQPDSIHSAFLVLAVVFLIGKQPIASLAMMALALLSKPQPMVFVPLVVLIIVVSYPIKQSLKAALVAGAVSLLVFLPLLVDPNRAVLIGNMLSIIRRVNPVVSANAHNFWWLVLAPQGIEPRRLYDETVVFMGLSYFLLSMLIVLGFYVAIATGVLKKAREYISPEHFAYLGLVFFVFGVRMHENHSMQILPLLALTGFALSHQRVVFAMLTVGFLLNMALHSAEIVGQEESAGIHLAQVMNSALIVAAFGYWSVRVYRQLRYDSAKPCDSILEHAV